MLRREFTNGTAARQQSLRAAQWHSPITSVECGVKPSYKLDQLNMGFVGGDI